MAERLTTPIEDFEFDHDRAFLEAAMGASALVAWADEDVSAHETAVRDFCLNTVSKLKSFDTDQAAVLFSRYIEALRHDLQQAKTQILQQVAMFTEDEEAKRLIIGMCVAIGKADYDFSEAEREVFAELCTVLGTTVSEVLAPLRNLEEKPNLNVDPLTGSTLD